VYILETCNVQWKGEDSSVKSSDVQQVGNAHTPGVGTLGQDRTERYTTGQHGIRLGFAGSGNPQVVNGQWSNGERSTELISGA
jgi:hypothetical protein